MACFRRNPAASSGGTGARRRERPDARVARTWTGRSPSGTSGSTGGGSAVADARNIPLPPRPANPANPAGPLRGRVSRPDPGGSPGTCTRRCPARVACAGRVRDLTFSPVRRAVRRVSGPRRVHLIFLSPRAVSPGSPGPPGLGQNPPDAHVTPSESSPSASARDPRLPGRPVPAGLPLRRPRSSACADSGGGEESSIRGTVVDAASGRGIPAALVEFVDQGGLVRASATSREDGSFVLARVPRGEFRLRVSSLGYSRTLTVPSRIEGGEALTLVVRLSPSALALAPLEVTASARATSPVLASFYARAERGFGGAFLTRDDIERAGPVRGVSDLVAGLTGVTARSATRPGSAPGHLPLGEYLLNRGTPLPGAGLPGWGSRRVAQPAGRGLPRGGTAGPPGDAARRWKGSRSTGRSRRSLRSS
jgi:hypothetical protein